MQWENRVVIPFQLHESILEDLHKSHHGIVRMKMLARPYFWWSSLDEILENYVKVRFMSMKSNMADLVPICPWECANKPWFCIHLDFERSYHRKKKFNRIIFEMD